MTSQTINLLSELLLRIDLGRLNPGDVIDEQELVDTYAVSRAPEREALLQREAMGLIRRLPPMETGDGFTGNDAPHGIAASLTEALDDRQADTALCAAVGQGLVDNHIYMKRAEVTKTAGLQDDALRHLPCANRRGLAQLGRSAQ
jgi:hypothetical protein